MKRSDILKESLVNFLRVMGDLMLLNWLWFFCSLPVLTLGPATCAVYSVTLKLARGENVSTVRDFFRAFRENFRPGLVLGLLAVALGLVAFADWRFAQSLEGGASTLYTVLAILLAVLLLNLCAYVFALQAMFDAPLSRQLKNAFLLPFAAPGKTLVMWLTLVFPLAALLLPDTVIAMLGFLYIIMGVSGPVYLNCRRLRDVFDRVNGGALRPDPAETETE